MLAFGLAIVAAVVYALVPKPIAADLATIERGEIEVTIDEEGVTRVRDIYKVSATVGGYLDRFPLEVGDPVTGGKTVIAEIRPSVPSFLDARTRRELEAAVGAAAAGVRLAEAEVSRAQSDLRLREADLDRSARLHQSGTISARAMDEAQTAAETATAAVREARASLELRQSELASAEARLMQPTGDEAAVAECCMQILAPVDGVVLGVHAESAQVVAPGALIAEVGDPSQMEVAVDLLSTDAVRVTPGVAATIDGWGGEKQLAARVRRVEPAAFTKVSALGIEEQRVKVILDLLDPRLAWESLGNEYRVFVRIREWRGENAVRVPLAALYRVGDAWSVFRVADGKAAQTSVKLGRRNARFAEVLDGLSTGDTVILHPSDQIRDGVRVEVRQTSF
jgi:HlyD family secretion protein